MRIVTGQITSIISIPGKCSPLVNNDSRSLPVPRVHGKTPCASEDMRSASSGCVFICNDNDLANTCRSSLYNFSCTLEGFSNADFSLEICEAENKCSFELQSPTHTL